MQLTVKSSNRGLLLLALCLGFFMVIIDVTIVTVALPSMAKNLQGNISWLQWVVDGYTLTFACLLLSAGNLGDRVGAKTAYLVGLGGFVITSLGCGLATSFWALTLFRLLQGITAALIVPTSLALINSSYANQSERSKAIGTWAGLGGVAAASGPILGAMLTAWFGWRAVFFVNIPIGIIGFLLTLYYVPNLSRNNQESFDLAGQITAIISIAALAFSLIEAGRLGWQNHLVISSFIIFLAIFFIFIFIENRSVAPMFPLHFFKSKTFSTAISVGMALNLGIYGLLFILPLYFQQIRGYSVLMAGMAIVPLTALMGISSYFSGRITSFVGPKIPMVVGMAISAVGFLSLLITGEQSPTYLALIIPLAIIGFGPSFAMPAATIAAITAAPEGRAGIASGALNASRQIGSLIGVAIFGTIVSMTTHFVTGMHYVLVLAAIIYVISSVASFLYIKNISNC